jgi:hypothetical protein
VKAFVPLHVTPDWIGRELSRRAHERKSDRATRTTYIRPKTLSIREHIAQADKINQKP